MPARKLATLMLLAAGAVPATAGAVEPGQTLLASGPSGNVLLQPALTNHSSVWPGGTSADGRFVVFRSAADGLSAEDDNRFFNVFVRDTQDNTTILVSRATGAGGAAANESSYDPAISPDGTKVVFGSNAANLVAGDTNGHGDIFLRDLVANTTTLVSRADGASGAQGNDHSFEPSVGIGPGGVRVAFVSEATNLISGDTNGTFDVFVRDVVAASTALVSRADGPSGTIANEYSEVPSISADGLHVAFQSAANNLDNADTDTTDDIYVRHLATDETEYASLATDGTPSNGFSEYPSIDADGTHVAFDGNATNLAPDATSGLHIFRRTLGGTPETIAVDRPTGGNTGIGNGNAQIASISADANKVAFETGATNLTVDSDTNAGPDIHVRDVTAMTTTLMSRETGPSGAIGSKQSRAPSLSGDGSKVAFHSGATNLTSDNDDSFVNVYTRTGITTTLVSRPTGTGSNTGSTGESRAGDVSSDGRYVAFSSGSNSLSAVDDDSVTNVYVRDTVTGIVTFASRRADGVAADASSFAPTLSDDGSMLAFTSVANNLVPGVTGPDEHVYVRDMGSGALVVADRPDNDTATVGDGRAFSPDMSGDGTRVAFASVAFNLATADGWEHVYVRDLTTNDTFSADLADDDTTQGNSNASQPAIDFTGDRVAFQSSATDLESGVTSGDDKVYVRDIGAGTIELASRAAGASGAPVAASGPLISGDGNRVGFRTAELLDAADTVPGSDIYVRDLSSQTNTLASRADGAGGAPANDVSGGSSAMDGTGNRVAFQSSGALAPGDSGSSPSIFMRDISLGVTELVSRADGTSGADANGESRFPALSPDGCCAIFDSRGDNLPGSPGPDVFQTYLRGLTTVAPPPPPPPPAATPTPAGPPPPGPPAADATPPLLRLGGATLQRLVRARAVVITARPNEAAALRATGTLNVPRASKVFRLRAVRTSAAAGRRVTLRLRLPRAAIPAVRRALARKKRVTARITVTATDAAGNRATARRTVRAKR